MAEFFAMGGHAAYIWGAYGLAVLVLAGMVAATLMRRRASRRDLALLEQARGRRRRA